MSAHTVISAALASSRPSTSNHMYVQDYGAASSSHLRRVSYGATSTASTAQSSPNLNPPSIREEEDDDDDDQTEEDHEMDGDVTLTLGELYDEPNICLDMTWKETSRYYMLIPLFSAAFFGGLLLLITFAWPPTDRERRNGQTYPHPFFWKPFIIGIFASCTVQTIRVSVYVILSWFDSPASVTAFLSTTTHTLLHELLRLSSIPLTHKSPLSGFHSSYYLGLGWGIAETVWGIIQGYEQLALYEDIMRPEKDESPITLLTENGDGNGISLVESPIATEREALWELERKVEILESARARRDLEEIIAVPFPTIPFPLHLLWRIDTLLLNLGLTLILTAFYYDPVPIYRHHDDLPSSTKSRHAPSAYLWLAWALVAVLHVIVAIVWKNVGRFGIGAVTWGGLIVALGSVFAGLGAWGGLV